MTDAASQDPPKMRHRSFYMRSADIDLLAALVEDVHHQVRRPRHEVLAAAVHVLREHRAEIEARLTQVSSRVREERKDGASE